MISPADWRAATVVSREQAAEDMVAVRITPDHPVSHTPGQHYEIRIPRDALSRKFSIVSSPANCEILEFGIQILKNGMVSPRLGRVAPGEPLEIRGPLGRAFGWSPRVSGNLLLLGAGAGATPLLSMWDDFHENHCPGICRFALSAKTPGRVYRYERYSDWQELRFTSSGPRLDRGDLERLLSGMPRSDLSVRICGPSGFITTMANNLVALGVDEARIRSEGFA